MTKKKGILCLLLFALLIALLGCGEKDKTGGSIKSESAETGQTHPVLTFIELGSVKCVPCRMMQPVMEQIEEEYTETVRVIFYDVWTDEGRPYGEQFGIRVIPTQIFLDRNGEEYFRHEGFFPKEELEQVLLMKLQ